MRPPPRAVGDDHVDRPEVRRPRGQSRPVLMARAASRAAAGRNRPRGRRARPPFPCVARHHQHQRVRAHRPPFRAATAAGLHLFPSRTEQLSPPAPMVLPATGGRVGRRHPAPRVPWPPGLFFAPAAWPQRTAGGGWCSALPQTLRHVFTSEVWASLLHFLGMEEESKLFDACG